MEKSIREAQEYGFTETVDCGSVLVHIFDQDYLEQNTSSDKPINLASATFDERIIPCLLDSGLELLPEKDDYPRLLTGYMNFETPSRWMHGSYTNAICLKQLNLYLRSLDDFGNLAIELGSNAITINKPSQPPITIALLTNNYAEACFEMEATLETNKPFSDRYQDIVFSAAIWGHLHNFVITSDKELYNNKPLGKPKDLYIGDTEEIQISDTQLSLQAILALLRQKDPTMTLPDWGDDIMPKELVMQERHLTPDETHAIALGIIQTKRDFYGAEGDMVAISQYDIVDALKTSLSLRNSRSS